MIRKTTLKLTEEKSLAVTADLQVIIQYMVQQVMIEGMNTSAFSRIFKKPAMNGMKRAEVPAGRLFRFPGVSGAKGPHLFRSQPSSSL